MKKYYDWYDFHNFTISAIKYNETINFTVYNINKRNFFNVNEMNGNHFDEQYQFLSLTEYNENQDLNKILSNKTFQQNKARKCDEFYYFFFLLTIFLIKGWINYRRRVFGCIFLSCVKLILLNSKFQGNFAESKLKHCSNHEFFTIEIMKTMSDVNFLCFNFQLRMYII